MPLGNPIRKQNESRMVSVLATEGQTVFTVQGGYIINHISVFRNGVRLSPAEDFTAGDGSTVTLNNAANIDDRVDFHIFDRFTVSGAIVSAASTQTISGDVVVNGKIFGNLDVPNINTGIVTATELDLNGKAIIGTGVTIDQNNFEVAGISTFLNSVNFKANAFIREGYALRLENGFKDEESRILNSGTSDNANIVFQTGSGGTLSEAMRIDPSGRLLTGGAVIAQGSTNADDLQIGANNQGNQTGITLGSASASSVRFSDAAQDSAGMIFYDHATNHLGLYANNSERLRIFSNGGVNIGAASSTSGLSPILHLHKNASNDTAYLHITSNDTGITASDGLLLGINASGDALVFNKDSTPLRLATANSERMRITSDGKIGINETSPGQRLTVGGDIQIGFNTPTDAGRQLNFNVNRGSAGDTLANINWQWNSKFVAQIRGIAGSDTTNKDDAHLAFFTSSANNLTERLRITSDGRVGIGIDANLACALHVKHATNNEQARFESGDEYVHIGFKDSTTSSVPYLGAQGDHLRFITSGTERLRIDASGNLVTGAQTSPTSSDTGNIYIKNGSAFGAVSHQINYVSNAVFDGAWKYITSSVGATRIVVNQNGFQFDLAGSGTAGNNITFTEKMSVVTGGIEVTGDTQSTDFKYASHPGVASFTGDNSTTTMTIASGHNVNSVLVVYNGVVLTPTTDYTISGTTLTFTFTPLTSSQVVVRYLIK